MTCEAEGPAQPVTLQQLTYTDTRTVEMSRAPQIRHRTMMLGLCQLSHTLEIQRLPERQTSQTSQPEQDQSRAPTLLRFISFAVACWEGQYQSHKERS